MIQSIQFKNPLDTNLSQSAMSCEIFLLYSFNFISAIVVRSCNFDLLSPTLTTFQIELMHRNHSWTWRENAIKGKCEETLKRVYSRSCRGPEFESRQGWRTKNKSVRYLFL